MTKPRAHQIAEEKGFPAPLAEDTRGRSLEPVRGAGGGEALARREALALAEELEPLLRRRIHAIICSRTATSAGETSVSGQPGQGERWESATDVRLDGDEVAADADDGDAGHATGTYMRPAGRYWDHSRGYPTDGSTRTRCAEPGRVTPVTFPERTSTLSPSADNAPAPNTTSEGAL